MQRIFPVPKTLLLFSLAWPLPLLLPAQFGETIRTGRPGQAIGPFTVGKNVFQAQQGIDYYETSKGFLLKSMVTNHVFRFGLTETVEISTVTDYRNDKIKFSDTTFTFSGFSNLQIGGRIHLMDNKGIRPSLSIQARVRTPWGSEEYQTNNFTPVVIVATGNKIGEKSGLSTNYIFSYGGGRLIANYVLNYGLSLTEKIGIFAEAYGAILPDATVLFDTGFSFLANSDLQFDLFGGYGMNRGVQDWFISTGISWRMHKRSQKVE